MGKASSSKKVARAAGTGGGRTNRGKTPVLWYGTLLLILLLGVGLTAFSRDSRMEELGSPESKEEPRANDTHWHVAFGVRVCDRWLDPITDQTTDPKGIHSHADGIIHVHPFVASAAGKNAVLQRYAEMASGDLEANRFSWPVGDGKKKETRKNGDKCGDQVGEVKAFYNGQPHEGDPGEIRFTDRGKLVLAFVPTGTTYEQIGDPPSTPGLDNLSDVDPSENQQPQQVPVPGAPGAEGAPPVGVAPGDSTPPAAPGDSTPPAAPGAATPPASAAPGASAPPASAAPPASGAPPASAPAG